MAKTDARPMPEKTVFVRVARGVAAATALAGIWLLLVDCSSGASAPSAPSADSGATGMGGPDAATSAPVSGSDASAAAVSSALPRDAGPPPTASADGGCGAGTTPCGTACVDLTSSAANCGACGKACTSPLVCSQGKCAAGCAGQLALCGSSCVDTSGSSQNCGSCGHACPPDQSCWMGGCRCPTGQGTCGAGGQCVDIMTSAQHCGGCTACATGASCAAGVCACPAGQSVCAGVCVDRNTDPKNCGACGTSCTAAGTQCLYGGCIDPSSVSCGSSVMTGNSCTANASVPLGKYWVNDNQWGVAAGGTTGQQCVWGACQAGDLVGWGTSWNWTPGNGGVKTFASLVFGWQWGWKVTNTGLPVQLSANRAVNCGWDFTVSQTGTLNVSYDTWLHAIANPGATDTPTEEVMVWLYTAGGAGPIGPRVAQGVSLAGTTWDLHQGPGGASWPVSSYVRTGNATTSVMNMMVFYADLVSRGWMPNTRYLSSIQAGSEVFSGTGSLTTNGFYCRVQ